MELAVETNLLIHITYTKVLGIFFHFIKAIKIIKYIIFATIMDPDDLEEPNPTLYIGKLKK